MIDAINESQSGAITVTKQPKAIQIELPSFIVCPKVYMYIQEVLTHRGFSGERKNRDKRNPR